MYSGSGFSDWEIGDITVIIYKETYHLFHLIIPNHDYIAHAVSTDGISWKREGKPIISDVLNENECQALPTVIEHNNRYHMVFCFREATGFRKIKERGYRIGYAYSDDLKNWTRADDEVGIHTTEGEWDSDMMCYPHVFHCNEKIYLIYNGNEFGRYGFGIAAMEN